MKFLRKIWLVIKRLFAHHPAHPPVLAEPEHNHDCHVHALKAELVELKKAAQAVVTKIEAEGEKK